MIPYVIAGIAGAIFMARTKPKTAIKSYLCLGPRTGNRYTVETLPGGDVINVIADDGTNALFKREDGSFKLLQPLAGLPLTIHTMQKDFEP